jgi:molecular chaperone GrpE
VILENDGKKETEGTEKTAEDQPQAKVTEPETEQPRKEGKGRKEKTKKADEAESKAENESQGEQLKQELEAAKAEAAKQKDLLMRTAAEYDNFRKRTEREKDALYTNATSDAVQEFLPVADNLERALSQKECSVEDLRKGIEMVLKQMNKALEKLGVKPMGEKGEPFDSQFHNAVSHVEDEKVGENVIMEVYQKGYMIGDKVVRHAMVQVAN